MIKQRTSIALFLVLLLAPATAFAEQIVVSVNGMVCSFCAAGIKKHFASHDSVKKIDVKLGEKRVLLDLKEGKTISDDEVKDIVEKSGYAVQEITRK